MKNILQDKIKKYGDKADFLEIRYEERRDEKVMFISKELQTPTIGNSSGGCVRALYKGGWGFTTFNNITELDNMIENAIAQAKITSGNPFELAPILPIVTDVLLNTINNPVEVKLETKIDILKGYNEIVLSHGGAVKNSSASYSDNFVKKYYATNEGTLIYQEYIDCSFAIGITATDNGLSQSQSVSNGSTRDFNMIYGFEKEIKEKCYETEKLLKAPKVKAGIYPVIVDPVLGGVFVHEAFGHTMEADSIMSKPDLMETLKIGEEFGSKNLSIYDSGLDSGTRGQIHYDDEGVPSQKTYILKDGILVNHLHSRETAAKMKAAPTGNARAMNYNYAPICRMRNTCIDAGTNTFKEMVEGIDEGILAIDAYGGSGGESFSFTAGKGYMIRKGKIEELVRDVDLSGNLFKTLKNIDMIGDKQGIHDGAGGCGKGEQFPLPVTHGSPYLRIQNVTLGGE